MQGTTTIVTVTYGDRLRYLEQLVERALGFAAIDRVLIVSNASTAPLASPTRTSGIRGSRPMTLMIPAAMS